VRLMAVILPHSRTTMRRPDKHEVIRPTLVRISLLPRLGQACGAAEVGGLAWLDVCGKAARTFAVWIVRGRG